MNHYFVYDGSMDGLLCAYAKAIILDLNPVFCVDERDISELFAVKHIIETHDIDIENVFTKLRCFFDDTDFYRLSLVFLSEVDGFEKIIFDYLRLILSGNVNKGDMSNTVVNKYIKIYNKVSGEVHRLKGLIRFRALKDGFLYAPFEPDHNVLMLLVTHFKNRISDKWILHDKKRSIGVLWDGSCYEQFCVDEVVDDLSGLLSTDERLFQQIWKQYYKSIAIKERKNPKTQKNFMPKRYWKYLIEEPQV